MSDRMSALVALRKRFAQAAVEQRADAVLGADAVREAVDLAAATDIDRDVEAAYVLGLFHWYRYLGLPESVDEDELTVAAALFGTVRRHAPQEVPEDLEQILREDAFHDPVSAANRALELSRLYDRTGKRRLLVRAVGLLRRSAGSAADFPGRAIVLMNLGGGLLKLFERSGDEALLTEAIDALRTAVSIGPAPGDPFAGALLWSQLGTILKASHNRFGDTAALRESIAAHRAALAAARPDHPLRATILTNLSSALLELANAAGDDDALAETVRTCRDTVAALAADDASRAIVLTNLAAGLRESFLRTGDDAALLEAVEVLRDAIDASPRYHVERPARLASLGNALRLRFERTGHIALVVEAVEHLRAALAETPAGRPDRAERLTDLSGALVRQFEATGASELLEEAGETILTALAATPTEDVRHAARTANLAALLLMLSRREGNVPMLRDAVRAARAGLDATPGTHAERADRQSNLATVLFRLYRETSDLDALREAVEHSRAAVAATRVGHPRRSTAQSHLAVMLVNLSDATSDPELLVEAVAAGRAAVAAVPEDSPSMAGALMNLGSALLSSSGYPGQAALADEALDCYMRAGENTAVSVAERITAYRIAAGLAGIGGRSLGQAIAAVEAAVALLPKVASRALRLIDRGHHLARLTLLAEEAAALSVECGKPVRAVELLEQTRGILVADTLNARSSDLGRLRKAAPALADAFEELRDRFDALELAGAASSGTGAVESAEEARRIKRNLAAERQEAHAAWEDLLARIRAEDGFATFLRAPDFSWLAAQAEHGPIVVLYTSDVRSDALIVTADADDSVHVVPLSGLTPAEADGRADRLSAACLTVADRDTDPFSRIAAQAEVLDVLAWVWDVITEPVLTALGHTGMPGSDQEWPRVWWCPVGRLARLPLHAAGHRADLSDAGGDRRPDPRTVMDRVVSSYTPTIRSLAHAHAHARARRATASDSAVVVAAPDVAGADRLPGAATEVETLVGLLPGSVLLPRPTRDRVLAALPDYAVAHFACHSRADLSNPAASQLVLEDHEHAPLTVAHISTLNFTAELAYLSACDTSLTPPSLTNEALHVTGAFHLAGYRHVIGTMWPIADNAARDVAVDFYTDLTGNGTRPSDADRSAHAIHRAARRLRSRYPDLPILWAAYSHTGI
jgi:tetratricopeptide (TPR) repeat protein